MKEKFSKALAAVNRFVQSDLFIVFNALFVFVGWCTGEWVALLSVMAIINILPLFFSKDTRHLLSILMMFTLMISANRHNLSHYAPMLVIVLLLFIGIFFNFFFFKRDIKPLSVKRMHGFHFSLIALIVPAALSGLGSPYEHPLAVVAVLALMIVFALGYSFLVAANRDRADRKEIAEYLLKVLFAMGIVILLQMIVYFSRMENIEAVIKAVKTKNIALGWAGPNNVAPTLSMCIPATLYFCIKRNRYTPFVVCLALIEFVALFATGCRGAILFTTMALPAMLLYVTVKSENKLTFCLTLCLLFAAAIVLVALNGQTVVEILTVILNKGLNSSGRTTWLYPEAIEAFKKWPIFGAGWDYRLGELAKKGDGYTPYWYHSTFFQILADMGLVGLIFFLLFYFFRYRTFLADRKNPSSLALLMGLGLFDAYGMVDTNFFGPTFFVMLLAMTFAVEIGLDDDVCMIWKNPFGFLKKGCHLSQSKTDPQSVEKEPTNQDNIN